MLAWLVLSIAVSVASPWMKPPSGELVCGAAGMVSVQIPADSGDGTPSFRMLDCPLCLSFAAPPPLIKAPVQLSLENVHVDGLRESASITVRHAALPPARGPPAVA